MNGSGPDPVREYGQASILRYAAGVLTTGVTLFATALPASAASPGGSAASSETLFVVEIGVLLLVGRLMGEAAQRIGQPPVMGQLIGGLLLGPSVFGVIWPEAQHLCFRIPARSRA